MSSDIANCMIPSVCLNTRFLSYIFNWIKEEQAMSIITLTMSTVLMLSILAMLVGCLEAISRALVYHVYSLNKESLLKGKA